MNKNQKDSLMIGSIFYSTITHFQYMVIDIENNKRVTVWIYNVGTIPNVFWTFASFELESGGFYLVME